MATLDQLESAGDLLRHTADLENHELPSRYISHSPFFKCWREIVLKPAPRKMGRNLSPYEQVEQLFYDFILGRPMAYSVNYRKLDPLGLHIWELKTQDVRIFGWFIKKGHFLAIGGEFKDALPSARHYKPYIKCVADYRAAIDLDEPKAITGVNHNDVL